MAVSTREQVYAAAVAKTDIYITPNFKLSELFASDTAKARGIDNRTADPEVIGNLYDLVVDVLQPIRDHFNLPMKINSAYRCHDLNVAVGSKDTSQHRKGEAADIEIEGLPNIELAKWITENLTFDQVILEGVRDHNDPNSGWVHVSYNGDGNRKMVLNSTDGRKFSAGLVG